uniref:Selenoprotein H n=1 Tax=Magallana gigas TaxID=29159 RepID=K1QN44_MAGGI|eukprot:XP_011412475.2 PREDICTED: selenoprotein H [Crassostrea gigas]
MPPRKRKTVTKTTNVSEETVAEKKAKSSAPVPRVYKKKATALAEAIKAEVEDIHIEYNPSAPRRGSFEVTLIVGDGETQEVLLWSGIKKGPPRKLKFPEDHKLITEMMKKNLNA